MDSVRTLSSVGAGDLILKCSVIDMPTSVLLTKAGAALQDLSMNVSARQRHYYDPPPTTDLLFPTDPCLNPKIRNARRH